MENFNGMISKVLDRGDARDPNRPYNGQSWTDDGERGKHFVGGLTMRDVKDCLLIAAEELTGEKDPSLEGMDLIVLASAMTCEIEKRMGIFPNIKTGSDLESVLLEVPMVDLPVHNQVH
jgi:hypothetical protein